MACLICSQTKPWFGHLQLQKCKSEISFSSLTTMQWLDWSQDRLLLTQSRCHNWRRAQLEKIKRPKCPNSRFFAWRQQPQELWWVGPWQAISPTKRRLPPIVSDPAKAAARHSSLGKLKTNTNPPANHIYHLQICWETNKQISKAKQFKHSLTNHW